MSGFRVSPWLPLVTGLGFAATGLRMILRPAAHLGIGTPPAIDPRTLRFFGYVSVAAGLVGLGTALIRVLKG